MTRVCDRGGRSQRLWELAPTIRGPVGLQLASGLTLDLITPKPTRSVHLLDQPPLEAIDGIDGWDGYLYETARALPDTGHSEHHVRAKVIERALTHLSSEGVVEAITRDATRSDWRGWNRPTNSGSGSNSSVGGRASSTCWGAVATAGISYTAWPTEWTGTPRWAALVMTATNVPLADLAVYSVWPGTLSW